MIEDYLDELVARIKNPFVRRKIRREIMEHFEDAIAYYEGLHFSKEEAENMALSDMGDVKALAAAFNEVYSWRKTSMLLIKILFVLLLSLLLYYLYQN